jgi:NAD(P)-dependent dehydrogenase (short-subunit alcohol dehydrogenase family)
MKLKGKQVLITGATGGIGRALSFEFASKGCKIALTGRNIPKLKALQRDLLAKYKSAEVAYYCADLSSDKELFGVIERFSSADILINNAGMFPMKSLLDSTLRDFDECMAINVRAPFVLSHYFGSAMREKKWGRIVNIGSSSAYYGNGATGIYCTSKHALLGLSRSLYQELRDSGVRVYNISPGSAQTSMGKTDVKQDFKTFIKPQEIAEYISFIVSYDKEMISEEVRLNRIVVK